MSKPDELLPCFWIRVPLKDRFWSKVSLPHGTTSDDCWEWAGTRSSKGYGIIQIDANRKRKRATHVAWTLYRGEVPEGMWLLHRCDCPSCVNPNHLFLGNGGDNARDRDAKGRTRNQNMFKTHCKHGHPLSGENLFLTKRPGGKFDRSCHTCQAGWNRNRSSKNKLKKL